MNTKSKSVLFAGTALVALMLSFPPWDYFDPNTSGTSSAGYHFFLSPPDPKTANFRYNVTFPEHIRVRKNPVRLTLQLLIVIPMTLGLAILFRTNRSFVTVLAGVFLLVTPVFGVVFLAWIIVGEGLHNRNWFLP